METKTTLSQRLWGIAPQQWRQPAVLAQAAIIAALYVVLTFVFLPISFGMVQFRIAELLMLLCAFLPGATPGVILGCLLANILGQVGMVDIVFGTLATALAAIVTAALAQRLSLGARGTVPGTVSSASQKFQWAYLLLPLPTVISNALIVGTYLPLILTDVQFTVPVWLLSMLTVGLGEVGVLYILGIPAVWILERTGVFKRLHTETRLKH